TDTGNRNGRCDPLLCPSTRSSRRMGDVGGPSDRENRMRILAIALAALLVAGCNVPDADVSATTTPSRSTTIPEREDPDLVPERFRGDYAADTPACSTSAHESRLTIGAWRIRFHES